jgi:D-sedoheptulose 7-phosphate isomerase
MAGTDHSADHSAVYLAAAVELTRAVQPERIDAIAGGLANVRERGGRLFVLGVGGGAGHASHAVNDFRKLCGLESYAPTDNVSELTARTNDDGWETSFSAWLEVSRLCDRDALLVFSVGGGSREHNVSTNLVSAMEAARDVGARIYGVVGAPGGTLAELAELAILIEPPPALRTPLVESLQAVVWHALVSHPELAVKQGHWESLAARAKP